MQAFMFPETARALLAKSREFTTAKRAERETAKRQAAEFNEALAQLMRLQWPEQAARELASIKVYGSL